MPRLKANPVPVPPRRSSSRKAKDAASDFVKRVMLGTWEDTRDVSPAPVKAKSKKSPKKTTSNVARKGRSPSPITTRSRSESPRVDRNTDVSKNKGQMLKKVGNKETHDSLKSSPVPGPEVVEKPTRGRKKRLPESPIIDEAPISPVSSTTSEEITSRDDDNENEDVPSTEGNDQTEQAPPARDTLQDIIDEVAKSTDKAIIMKDRSQETIVPKKPRGRPRKYPLPVEQIADVKLEIKEEVITPEAKKKPGPKRSPNEPPSWMLAGKQKPGRKTDAQRAERAVTDGNATVTLKSSLMNIKPKRKNSKASISRQNSNSDGILTEIKDESSDHLPHRVKRGPKKKRKIVSDSSTVVALNCESMMEDEDIKQEKKDETQSTMDSTEESSQDSEAGPMPYPKESDQAGFFNIFGLVKKSDMRSKALKNKLHREVGGKLRRVVKPRMAPEMVYNKLTLAKGCVLEGEGEEKTSTAGTSKDSPRLSHKSRAIQAEQLKSKPKLMSEVKRPGTVKLSMSELELAETLLNQGNLAAVRMLLLEGKLPEPEVPKKRQWLKPPERKSLSPNKKPIRSDDEVSENRSASSCTESDVPSTSNKGKQSLSLNVKEGKPPQAGKSTKKTALIRSSSVGDSQDDSDNVLKKCSLRKHSSFGASPVKDDTVGSRRSSRQQGGERKQWWHLLRAAPDEFEEDKKWDEEQDRLTQKRKVLKERKERDMLMEQLMIKEEEMEDEEMPSSQESSQSSADSKGTKRQNTDPELADQQKKKKTKKDVEADGLRQVSQSSDASQYADAYEEFKFGEKIAQRKDWVLAKRVLEEAKARGGEVCLESILLNLRRKELQQEAAEAAEMAQLQQQKTIGAKKKKKKVTMPTRDPLMSPCHDDLVQQIQPLLKDLMQNESGESGMMQLEMELEAGLSADMKKETTNVDEPAEPELELLPPVAISEGEQCTIPHMCATCWINDHMYCLNMKRIARDLPPLGGCLHYSLCPHYPRKDIEHKSPHNKTKLVGSEGPVDLYASKDLDKSGTKSVLEPVTEGDLFCEENMPESDESTPGTPTPGTEVLKAQIKARAAQIAESLGVPAHEAQTPGTKRVLKQVTYDDVGDEEDPEGLNIAVNQHGAELVLYRGRSYLPNHEFSEHDGTTPPGWLESLSALKQSPHSSKMQKLSPEMNSNAKKLMVRLRPPAAPNISVKSLKDLGSTHKLVRVKVYREGANKIILKHMHDAGGGKVEEVLVREIELPAQSGGKSGELDVQWLSNILAEEAVKLTTTEENVTKSDPKIMKKKKKKKKAAKDIRPAPEVNLTDTQSTASTSENVSDNVAWTMETISDDEEEEIEEKQVATPPDFTRDITLEEVNTNLAKHICPEQSKECQGADLAIQLKNLSMEVPAMLESHLFRVENGSITLKINTGDIRREDPGVMSCLEDPRILSALCYKLQHRRDAFKNMLKESADICSLIDDEIHQQSCLLGALYSEKSMLQDEVRENRKQINEAASGIRMYSKYHEVAEEKREKEEDYISSCMEILHSIQREGLLESHPQEITRIENLNTKMMKALGGQDGEMTDGASLGHPELQNEQLGELTMDASAHNPKLIAHKALHPGSVEADIIKSLSASTSSKTPEGRQMVYLQPMSMSMSMSQGNTQSIQTSSGEVLMLKPVTMTKGSRMATSTTAYKSRSPITVSPTCKSPAVVVHPTTPLLKSKTPISSKLSKSGGQHMTLTLEQLERAGVKIDNLLRCKVKEGKVVAEIGGKRANVLLQGAGASKTGSILPQTSLAKVTLPSNLVAHGFSVLPMSVSTGSSSVQTQPSSVMVAAGAGVQRRMFTSTVQPIVSANQQRAMSQSLIASANQQSSLTKPSVASSHQQQVLAQPVAISANQQSLVTPSAGMNKLSTTGLSMLSGSLGTNIKSRLTLSGPLGSISNAAMTTTVPSNLVNLTKGIRVLSAAGSPANMPKLSPSVLSSIGPNDQVVVLSASQLQQLQNAPFKPVQFRIPVSKQLPNIAPRPNPAVVSTSRQTKDSRSRAKKTSDTWSRLKINPVQTPTSSNPNFLYIGHQGVQMRAKHAPAKSILSTTLQQQPRPVLTTTTNSNSGLGPMEAFEALVNEASQQDKLTDLVQLAMADCELPLDAQNAKAAAAGNSGATSQIKPVSVAMQPGDRSLVDLNSGFGTQQILSSPEINTAQKNTTYEIISQSQDDGDTQQVTYEILSEETPSTSIQEASSAETASTVTVEVVNSDSVNTQYRNISNVQVIESTPGADLMEYGDISNVQVIDAASEPNITSYEYAQNIVDINSGMNNTNYEEAPNVQIIDSVPQNTNVSFDDVESVQQVMDIQDGNFTQKDMLSDMSSVQVMTSMAENSGENVQYLHSDIMLGDVSRSTQNINVGVENISTPNTSDVQMYITSENVEVIGNTSQDNMDNNITQGVQMAPASIVEQDGFQMIQGSEQYINDPNVQVIENISADNSTTIQYVENIPANDISLQQNMEVSASLASGPGMTQVQYVDNNMTSSESKMVQIQYPDGTHGHIQMMRPAQKSLIDADLIQTAKLRQTGNLIPETVSSFAHETVESDKPRVEVVEDVQGANGVQYLNDKGTVQYVNEDGTVQYVNEDGTVQYVTEEGNVQYVDVGGNVQYQIVNEDSTVQYLNEESVQYVNEEGIVQYTNVESAGAGIVQETETNAVQYANEVDSTQVVENANIQYVNEHEDTNIVQYTNDETGPQYANETKYANETQPVQYVDVNEKGTVQYVNEANTSQYVNETNSVQYVNETDGVQYVNEAGSVQYANEEAYETAQTLSQLQYEQITEPQAGQCENNVQMVQYDPANLDVVSAQYVEEPSIVTDEQSSAYHSAENNLTESVIGGTSAQFQSDDAVTMESMSQYNPEENLVYQESTPVEIDTMDANALNYQIVDQVNSGIELSSVASNLDHVTEVVDHVTAGGHVISEMSNLLQLDSTCKPGDVPLEMLTTSSNILDNYNSMATEETMVMEAPATDNIMLTEENRNQFEPCEKEVFSHEVYHQEEVHTHEQTEPMEYEDS